MLIRFDKADGIIRIYNGTIHLTLLDTKKYDAISDRIRYLIRYLKSKKQYHIYFLSLFAKIKVDSYDSFPVEEILTLHNQF